MRRQNRQYYTPDDVTDGVHVIADPTDTWADGQPVQKTFYDFLMCGNQVIDTFTWMRTGNGTSASHCDLPRSPAYGDPLSVIIDPTMGGKWRERCRRCLQRSERGAVRE